MRQKLADYVMDFIAACGVGHVFVLPGGGAMHLNDSLGKHSKLVAVTNLHEQAATIAAESYGKITGNLGVAMVTSGPGGTNAVTGVAGAWVDSSPLLVLSGQVKRSDLKADTGVRQRGMQELDIISVVRSITKYAALIEEPTSIRAHLERAVHAARTGRPGPVWLDIPLDVQAASIDTDDLVGWMPDAEAPVEEALLDARAEQVLEMLARSERPVLLAGNGVTLSGAREEFGALAELLGIPVLLTWPALDLLPSSHPLYAGRPGAMAPRYANFVLQNSDFLLSIGARLDLSITGYARDQFARAATTVMVDIDAAELRKLGAQIALPIEADARSFIRALSRALERRAPLRAPAADPRAAWIERCRGWRARYPVVPPEDYDRQEAVSTYVFTEELSRCLSPGDVLAPGCSGAAIEIFYLVVEVEEGERCINCAALGAMGYGPPSAIGACLGSGGRRTICVDGDGGFQLNVQELATIARLDLPVKLFVINNGGFASIRNSQRRYFDRLVGADESSGLRLPPLDKVAEAYGVRYARIESQAGLRTRITELLAAPGPLLCEVIAPSTEIRAPALGTVQKPDGALVSRPLEDLWPYLDRDEFRSNMLIPPVEEP